MNPSRRSFLKTLGATLLAVPFLGRAQTRLDFRKEWKEFLSHPHKVPLPGLRREAGWVPYTQLNTATPCYVMRRSPNGKSWQTWDINNGDIYKGGQLVAQIGDARDWMGAETPGLSLGHRVKLPPLVDYRKYL